MSPANVAGAVAALGGALFLIFGAPRPRPLELPALAVAIEETPGGRKATIDEAAWRSAFAAAGLPEPPLLSGLEPEPLQKAAAAAERWAATREPEALGELGLSYLVLNRPRQAAEVLAAATALAADEFRWTYHLGAACQLLRADRLAAEYLERARRMRPEHAATTLRLGELYLDGGRIDDAAAAFEDHVQRWPQDFLGHLGAGRVLAARGDAPAAVAALQRAVALRPADFFTHHHLGRALALAGDSAGARREAEIAERFPRYSGWFNVDPELRDAYRLTGSQRYIEYELWAAQAAGDAAATERHARELARRRPADHAAQINLAQLARTAKRFDEAKTLARRAQELLPESAEPHFALAEIAFDQRAFAEAGAHLDAAERQEGDPARLGDLRGRIAFLEQRLPAAAAAFTRALAHDPQRSKTRLALAQTLASLGRIAESRAELARVLASEPQQPQALALAAAIEEAEKRAGRRVESSLSRPSPQGGKTP